MNHFLRTAVPPRRSGLIGVSVAGMLALSACGGTSSTTATTSTSTSTASTTASASTTSGTSIPDGSAPIGNGGINLGQTSTTSYPASMLSEDFARDCYNGGDRIYDRYGITCSGAQKVLNTYEASSHSKAGTQMTIGAYTCSHNPVIMVNQGAAPGKCVDNTGTVVFNWRYLGAPQPAKS